MQEITVFDIKGNSITDLVQWDKDVKIYVKENEIDKAYNVHFFNNKTKDTSMVVESTYQDGVLSAIIPNDLLVESYPIIGYIFVEKDDEHKSMYCFRIIIRKRPKPANYIYSDQKEYITFEKVLEEAKTYANNAKESADEAKQSEENANASKEAASESENMATQKAEESKVSAEQAAQSELNASKSESNALKNANDSEEYALESKSFAKGTGGMIRPNDDSDCAEYYYNQILQISQGIKGIIPMGSITFDELSLPNNEHEGFMFDISDSFISDERFKNGSGIPYGAGSNVIFTAEGKWDVLASSDVSGVKGDKETFYHQGFVNITPENVGAVATEGDISDTSVTFTESENRENIESGEKSNILFGKIKKWFFDLKRIAFTGDFNDLMNIPTSDELIEKFLVKAYPIGSIYLSINNINPSNLFGGEWIEWGSGRVPVGVNTSDTNFSTVEKSGGAASVELTENEMPYHNHSVGAHAHGLNNHTHSIPSLSGSTGGGGSHGHTVPTLRQKSGAMGGSGVINNYIYFSSAGGGGIPTSDTANHTHSVTINGSTTGQSSGTTENSSAFNTGTAGSGNAHSNLQPYITCYMWKRIA